MSDILKAMTARLSARLEGRSGADLAARSARISAAYRKMVSSAANVTGEDDVLAYALVRAPATFAAIRHVLGEAIERAPAFVPGTILDAGTGPGTAAWAAADIWPEAALTLMDNNQAFLDAAGQLARACGQASLQAAHIVHGDLRQLEAGTAPHDLVMAAFALTEIEDREMAQAGRQLWAMCAGVLVVVEPGRSRDHGRLMQVRAEIVASGGRVLAPCPHQAPCPLTAGDWCHFSQRLARGREHVRLKRGQLGHEDEKFSYLVCARPGVAGLSAEARVVAPPRVSKHDVTLPLCTDAGLRTDAAVPKRHAGYRMARKLRWGDAAEPERLRQS